MDLDQAIESEPGFMLTQLRNVEHFINRVQSLQLRTRSKAPLDYHQTSGPIQAMGISKWLQDNIRKPRVFKQKQLMIIAPPDCGKTGLINTLSEHLSIYHVPQLEDFDDMYQDDLFDLIVYDEFKGGRRITDLNRWLEGSTFPIRLKGGQRLKKENLPVIILSNYELQECYHSVRNQEMALAPLRARLTTIRIASHFKIAVVPHQPTSTSLT